jgi:hypothetical protein
MPETSRSAQISSDPTFGDLAESLRPLSGELVEEHVRRMRQHLPKWVLGDPVALQRIRELTEELFEAEIDDFRSDELPTSCPEPNARSAQELARFGQPVEMQLAGIRVGHRCLWEAWMGLVEERVSDRGARRELLDRGSRFMFDYQERVCGLVAEEYESERERIARNSGERRVQLVQELLNGEEVSSEALDWRLEHHHLGVLAWADGGEEAATALGEALGRPVLAIETGVEGSWFAWASSAQPLSERDRRAISRFAPERGRLALGLEAQGSDGFRLTHRQARRAGWVAWYTDLPVTRFEEVALEALAIEDAESARAMAARELHGFNDESVRSRRLRETLLAYFDAGHNAAAAAAALGVHHQTVANRIRTIEEETGAPVGARRAELELALRLRRCFEKPPSLQAGLQNAGYLP